MNIDLKELTQLAPIFRELFKGYHISRAAPELYTQLSNQQDAYRALFKSLGFDLVCDSRGFYYFVPEQMGAQVNKTAQRLALFTFILVEHLADQGRDPLAVLDGGSLGRDELPPLLEKYKNLFKGVNSRLDEIQAAMLRIKLQHLELETQNRRMIARVYLENIRNPAVQLPQLTSDEQHVWHLFVVRTSQRDALQNIWRNKAFKRWFTIRSRHISSRLIKSGMHEAIR